MFPWRVFIRVYYRYIVTGVIFLGGIGAIYTAHFWGIEWAQVVLGQEGRLTPSTIAALILAVPLGLFLGNMDERFTQQLYGGSRARRNVQSQAAQSIGMKYLPWPESTALLLFSAILRAFGEEGVRMGLWALFAEPLSIIPLLAAFLSGISLGLGHIIYGVYTVPAKVVVNLVISLALLYFGIVVAFLVHLSLNLYMLFDIQIIRE